MVTGVEELVGHPAVATRDFQWHEAEGRGQIRGQVRIRGEDWQAVSDRPISRGQLVRVLALDGLVLRVTPIGGAAAQASNGDPT